MSSGPKFEYELGFASHQGMEKEINEDNYCAERRETEDGKNMSLIALSDGMGGFSLGEIASKIAINQMEKFFKLGEFKQMFEESEFLEPPRVIQELYTRINHVIRSLMEKENRQVGCTLVSGFFYGNEVYIANVGNSRAYILRNGAIKKITEEKAEEGSIEIDLKKTTGESDPRNSKNAYVNALGSDITLKADIKKYKPEEGDVFLFCTDGLFTQLEDTDIVDVASESPTMQSFCNALVDRANLAGGKDNVTVVAIKFTRQKRSLGAILGGRGKGGKFYTNPVFIVGVLLVILFFLGAALLIKKYVSPAGKKGDEIPSKNVRYPPGYPGTYNSLTLTSDIPIRFITVNDETRTLKNKSRTFVFEEDENDVVIMPELKEVESKLYTIGISSYKRDLSVIQAKKNKVILEPDKVKVHLTYGSSIDFSTKHMYTGDLFVLKIDNLGSPLTIAMKTQENVEVEITADRERFKLSPTATPTTSPTTITIDGKEIIEVPDKVKGRKLEYKLE